ncbi:sugar porter family MFS transporter [Nesterenkonia flava]
MIYVFGALGGLNWGYDTGVISAALVYLRRDFALSSWSEGGIVTALAVGAVLGAALGGRLSDRYGRRAVLILTAALFTLAPVGMALSPTTEVLFGFRLMVGLGTGLAAVVLPVYLSEMAPARIRGRVTAFYVLAIVVGQFLGFLIGVAFAPVESWRWMLGLSVVPSLLFALGLLAVRETPRWLMRQGREVEARQLLLRDRTPAEAQGELEEIRTVQQQEDHDDVRGLRALAQPWVLSILLVGFGLGVYQQIMGINAVLYYAPTTLQNVGFSDEGAIASNLIIGALNILAVWVAITYTDSWGRRPMLLVGAAGTSISLAVLAAVNLTMPAPDGFGPLGAITLACLGLFIFLFQVSWGALVWVVLGEIFPLGVRAAAMGVVTAAHWIANGLVSLLFPSLLAAFGVGWVFAGFALICATAFGFTWAKVPETKERTLEQIERRFRSRRRAPA